MLKSTRVRARSRCIPVCIRDAGNTMYYRSTTALMFALNNYSGIVVSAGYICAPRYPRNCYSPRSRVNAIHAGRKIRVYARRFQRARARPREPMAHCLSHQSARFMRGFNEVIRLVAAINILVVGLTTLPPFAAAPLRLIGTFETDYAVNVHGVFRMSPSQLSRRPLLRCDRAFRRVA